MTIGIAVALYNGSRFLREQLECFYRQTRPADRVVLCDDGSTDDTPSIVGNFIRERGLQDTWSLERNPENLGYARNFYRAIGLCRTELVFLADQDDLWEPDKLEKMAEVMEGRPEILLLACRHGIIDAEGKRIHSPMEQESAPTGAVTPVSAEDVLRAYRWPGMAMCLRMDFFESIRETIQTRKAAHDFVFAIAAADRNGFYEYDYVGVYHRRHGNNAAHEEHRITKLLNLERKLRDIADYNRLLRDVAEMNLPITDGTADLLRRRLEISEKRENILRRRDRKGLRALYRSAPAGMLRRASYLCDIWLLWFGDYKHLKQ